MLCSLDLLSASGLVNFFGCYTNLDKIEVKPVLLKKGHTQLALYGLGSVRDERLHRMFRSNQVQFMRPKDETGDWFNLFVIHQNRSKHGATNYIPEQFLPNFLDLVFWGHEHECKIDPVWNSLQEFFVTQPGSSIATSMSQGEMEQKYVGILNIRGKEMKLEKIPLESVRQFYFEDIVMQETSLEPGDTNVDQKMQAFCEEKVEMLISRAGEGASWSPVCSDLLSVSSYGEKWAQETTQRAPYSS
jgi:double-strand break repair protein MRE11